MKLNVPYYSQFLDVEDKEWMPKACAVVCLKKCLDYHGKTEKTISEIIERGVELGGYGPHGWYHDAIVALAKENNLSAYREERMGEEGIEKLVESLKKENPVIISMIKLVFTQTKFHMVVLTGIEEENDNITGFYYHDPESLNREKASHLFVDMETFKKHWRKFAIFVYPLEG